MLYAGNLPSLYDFYVLWQCMGLGGRSFQDQSSTGRQDENGQRHPPHPHAGGLFLSGIKQRLLSFIFRRIWSEETDHTLVRCCNILWNYYLWAITMSVPFPKSWFHNSDKMQNIWLRYCKKLGMNIMISRMTWMHASFLQSSCH